MLYRLKRHPFAVQAWFDYSLVLTYAWPRPELEKLLPPWFELDGTGDLGFTAIALVQTRKLRPAGFPRFLGLDFFLAGYRIFTRFRDGRGRNLRGLRILRSETDSRLMVLLGNLLTHYGYRRVNVRTAREPLRVETESLCVTAYQPDHPQLPAGSPFQDWRQARRYAGPLPFTFDYERETHSVLLVEGVREHWNPVPVEVDVERSPVKAQLAAAFLTENVDYRWKPGVLEKIP